MSSKDTTNKIVAAVTFVVIVGGVASYSMLGQQPSAVPVSHTTPIPTSVTTTVPTVIPSVTFSSYKDGIYSAAGNYISPGGPEHINVDITLKDGVVVDAQVTPQADLPLSKRFQTSFADNYKQYVVGKNINDINITKVSGSSLTPKGFSDALAKIKDQAKS